MLWLGSSGPSMSMGQTSQLQDRPRARPNKCFVFLLAKGIHLRNNDELTHSWRVSCFFFPKGCQWLSFACLLVNPDTNANDHHISEDSGCVGFPTFSVSRTCRVPQANKSNGVSICPMVSTETTVVSHMSMCLFLPYM